MSKFILSAFADEIDTNLDIQMEVLEKHNICYIEMRGVNGKNLVDYTLDEVRKIKKILDERGFKLSAVGSPIGKIKITENFEEHLELFKHTVEIAKIMETKYIRMFSFFIPHGSNPDIYRDEVINRWSQFVRLAKGYDVVLLHENEKDIFGDTPERCLELLQTLDCDYVKLTFDPANFVQCGIKPYDQGYKLLKDYIEYIHIKDANFIDGNVVPAGYGDGQVVEVLRELKNIGFEGFISLEPHLGYFHGLDNLEIDHKWKSLPKGGEQLFAIATDSLKKILKEI